MKTFETVENWAIHAYADGELGEEDKRSVEHILFQDEGARRMLASIHHQTGALRAAYDPVLEESVPARLVAATRGSPIMKFSVRRLAAVAASVAFIAVGSVIGVGIEEHFDAVAAQTSLADRSFDAYKVYSSELRHPVEVAASDKDHLQQWLSKRIGVKFSVPDLTDKGYTLVGGRLLPQGDKPAGLLMYEDAAKHRLTIYVAANEAKNEAPMLIDQRGPVMTCYWVESDLVYGVTGEQPRDVMLSLAQAAHEGFDREG